MRFVLYRLRQLRLEEAIGPILRHFGRLQHVIDSVMKYLSSMRDVSTTLRRRIGGAAIATARKPSSGSYERMCLMSLFTESREFNHEDRFERLYEEFQDNATKRELVLALGRSAAAHWFMVRRQDYLALEPWAKRAFLAAFSCVAEDARGPFYRSVRGGADVLESAILNWVAANPFS